MNARPTDTGTLAIDAQGLDRLKLQAKRDPDRALGVAAKQFEALMLNMMLKSMRQATAQEGGLFDNEQSRLYTSMLDQQLAQHMSARGTGLADVMARQLGRSAGAKPADAPAQAGIPVSPMKMHDLGNAARPLPLDAQRLAPPAPAATPREAAPAPGAATPLTRTRDFVNRLWSHAVDAAKATGIQPRFMIAQAALETGWGKHEMRAADGTPSHNLFGVKAGRSWTGPVVEKTTTEYVNGVAQTTIAKFRAYSSYAEAFRDYGRVLAGNQRYAGVIAQGHDAANFARGLQQAGYATDPMYSDKLMRIINGRTLRDSLTG